MPLLTDKKRKYSEIEEVGLETDILENSNNISYTIIWIDDNVDEIKKDPIVRGRLRSIFEHIETFNNILQCEQFIKNVQNKIIYLIIPIKLNRSLLINLVSSSQSYGVYIYKENETDHSSMNNFEQFTWLFSKTFNNIKDLLTQLMIDTRTFHKNSTDKFPNKQSTAVFRNYLWDNEDLPSTSWFQYLMKMLCSIKYAPDCQQRFIEQFRRIYQNNEYNQRLLTEFEEQYNYSNAIRWYTRDCFLYHCLNKALREQDIDTILLLHFFIYDLFHQIGSICKVKKQNIPKTVYRGQIITKHEINYLNFSETKRYIYINAFFSTTIDRDTALIFAGADNYSIENSEQSVVFQINLDKKDDNDEYFGLYADVKEVSYNKDENEILFTMGNAFVINKVKYDQERKTWFIDLTFDHYGPEQSDWCDPEGEGKNEDTRQCQINLTNMIESTFIQIGYLLQSTIKTSADYRKISNYYFLLRQFIPYAFSIGGYYVGLGLLALEQKRYQLSFKYQKKALKFYSQKNIIKSTEVGSDHYSCCILLIIFNCIGSIYYLQNNINETINYYTNMLKSKINFSCFYPWTISEILDRLLYSARIWKERGQFNLVIQISDSIERIKESNLSFGSYFGTWLDKNSTGNIQIGAYSFLDQVLSIEYDADKSVQINRQLASRSMEQNKNFVNYVISNKKVEYSDILYARLGILYSQLKRMDLALHYFIAAIDSCPKATEGELFDVYTDYSYMKCLSRCYQENNQFTQSFHWLANAHEVHLQNTEDEKDRIRLTKEFCLDVVAIRKQQKKFPLALYSCLRAQKMDEKCSKIYEELADIYEQMKDYTNAKKCYQKAIELTQRHNEFGVDVWYESANMINNYRKKIQNINDKEQIIVTC
ncbi:unnamed protein product [Rotaria sp. Silwood1]|nr:unnamed protein product [Rotaria sp. Silwood1]